ncbi:hypothetical protein Syun_019732 [Stephania yunnanensis]|uniref:Uncharacterized protein n=1 Tax=Stephania yunnanensis TaxID=152371 RepID=A0AAP0IVU5_9MAGN
MEKFENVDYSELGFDPHIYGLLTGNLQSAQSANSSLKYLDIYTWHLCYCC